MCCEGMCESRELETLDGTFSVDPPPATGTNKNRKKKVYERKKKCQGRKNKRQKRRMMEIEREENMDECILKERQGRDMSIT
jgi:hypothetical protein